MGGLEIPNFSVFTLLPLELMTLGLGFRLGLVEFERTQTRPHNFCCMLMGIKLLLIYAGLSATINKV